MKQFKDLGITPNYKPMIGDKIKIDKVINIPVNVLDFKIEASKYKEKGNGKCLYIQIEHNGEKRIVFTGSIMLQDLIQQVPKNEFPFSTTIIKDNESFIFS